MYTDEQIQNLVTELSRNLVALFGNAIESAGLSIDNLGDETPDEEVASALVTAHTTAARQAIEQVTLFSALPELSGNEAWQAASSRMISSFSAFIDGVEIPGTNLEKLQNVVDFVNVLSELPVPHTGVALGDTQLGEFFGRADTVLTRFEMLDAFRHGDYSRLATTIAMCAVGYAVDAIIFAGFAAIGAVSWPFLIIGAGIAWTVSAFFEDEIDEFFQSQFANEETAFVVEQYTRLYGGKFANFDSIGAVAQVGTAGADVSFGLAGRVNLIGGGADEDLLVGNDLTDILGGGSGSDRLEGRGGDDILIAGDDNDVLIGGVGNDTLEGGDGHDTYRFVSADFADGPTNDVIADVDGLGAITFNGSNIAGTVEGFGGISHASLGAWETGDGMFRIWISNAGPDQTLVFMHRSSGSTIEVRGWQQGELGISLPAQPDEPEQTGWETILAGGVGNDYLQLYSPQGQLGNHYIGSAGDDMIYGTNTVRDDLIEGGAGHDLIYGAGGKDQIDGGSGNDQISGFGDESVVYGGDGNDFIAADMSSYVFLFSPTLSELNLAWSQFRSHLNWERPNEFLSDEDHNLRLFLEYSQLGAFDFTTANFRFEGTWGGIFTINDLSTPSQDTSWGDMSGSGSDQNTFEIIKGVSLYGGAGDDSISGSAASDFIDGGDDDDLIAGNGGNDVISGGYGEDSLAGGNGADGIDGGAGDDLIFGEADGDYISGGDGNDVLRGDGHADDAAEEGGNDVMFGGIGDDQMLGQGGKDTMFGQEGVDLMLGGAGSDELYGGQDNDELQGGSGIDYLYGEEGNDLLFGEAGNDYLHGGAGNDSLSGGEDDDRLHGAEGDDQLSGGVGDDMLTGGAGADHLDGGAGKDSLDGGDGNDQLAGFEDDDVINAGNGDDLANGGVGNDQINGGLGKDQLDGADGDDVIDGDAGDDLIYGGIGNDRASGGLGNDQIYGADGNDRLEGGEGGDHVNGAAGDDTLVGGGGNDFLVGGAGNDTYFFERGWGSDVIQQMGAADSGIDVISFGVGIEVADLSFAVSGESLVIRLIGTDDIITAAGYFSPNASASLAFADGSVITHQDLVQSLGVAIGAGSDDVINGTSGDDHLYGGDGNDTIYGLAGNDRLYGENGNDTLLGGVGNDILEGGAGNDTYHYDGFGYDTILGLADANAGSDVVQVALTSSRISNFQISGNDLVIGFTNANGAPGGLLMAGFMNAGNGRHRVEFADGAILTVENSALNIARTGTAGNDELRGDDSADTLTGYAGNDLLMGYAGNDTLNGGSGLDWLYGGAGDDVYRFETGSEVDTIYEDRGEGFDIIEIGAGISADDVTVSNTFDGVQLIVNGTTDRILLPGFVDHYNYQVGSHIPSQEGGIEEVRFADGTVWNYAELVRRLLLGTESDQSIIGTEVSDVIDGAGGDDSINGSNGNDILTGGSGHDYLQGGHGNDVYRFELGSGVDVISHEYTGGDDDTDYFDSIEFGSGISPDGISFVRSGDDLEIVVAETGGADKIVLSMHFHSEILFSQINSWINEIRFADGTVWDLSEIHRQMAEGTEYDDTFKGTAEDDVVTGRAGNDELYGQGGNDNLDGGDGNDRLNGDAGNDMLSGGAGDDELDGGDGYHDEDSGNLVLVPDTDTLEGGAGNDTLKGGIFQDTYVFNRGDGQDIVLEYGNEYGSDSYSEGLAETDIFRFGEAISVSDLEVTQEYDDLVIRLAGSSDQITFSNWFAGAEYRVEQFQFADGTVLSASDILTAPSTGGDDDLVGTDQDDYIDGLAGNDVISGLAGNDDLVGGEGNDVLMGGSGKDFLEGQNGDDAYRFQLGDGVDHIYNYDEAFDGSDFDVVEFGAGIAPGDIVLSGEDYGLRLQVAGTDDALVIDSYFSEYMNGESAYRVDEIRFADGTVWSQTAIAGMISGMVVDKIIEGTADDDTLWGGAGNDALYGGYGSDTYRFEAGFGQDIINDGSENSEEVDVVEFGAGLLASDFVVSQSGQDLILAGANESLTIQAYFYESDDFYYRIDQFRFADGTVWDHAQIAQMLLPGTEAGQTLSGSTQDDREAHDIWESGVGIQTKPLMISREMYLGDHARSVSDCQNLITMMGIAGRFDREAFNPHANEHAYSLIP